MIRQGCGAADASPSVWGWPRRELRLALLVAVVTATAAVVVPFPVSAQDRSVDADVHVRGGEVYQANCAACHGTRAEGGQGEGDLDGPPLLGLPVAYVDLTVRTGRMPIPAPSVGVHADQLDADDRDALVAYATDRFGLVGGLPDVASGDPARGQELYVRNCAACHGAAGGGGISGANVRVPPLVGLDGIAIASATRVGPFEMPAFDEAVLDDADIDDIVGYLDLVAATPRTAAGVREVDKITGALFGLGLGLAAGVVVLVVARARRWYPDEPEGFHTAPPFESRPGYRDPDEPGS